MGVSGVLNSMLNPCRRNPHSKIPCEMTMIGITSILSYLPLSRNRLTLSAMKIHSMAINGGVYFRNEGPGIVMIVAMRWMRK